MTRVRTILVVEDDDDDYFFTERALRRHTAANVVRLIDGSEAIAYLAGAGAYADRERYPVPDIVLLDLKLERGGGHDVLAAVRSHPPVPLPLIYVLTGSNEPRDRELVLRSGMARGFVVKPLSPEHVSRILGEAGVRSGD